MWAKLDASWSTGPLGVLRLLEHWVNVSTAPMVQQLMLNTPRVLFLECLTSSSSTFSFYSLFIPFLLFYFFFPFHIPNSFPPFLIGFSVFFYFLLFLLFTFSFPQGALDPSINLFFVCLSFVHLFFLPGF